MFTSCVNDRGEGWIVARLHSANATAVFYQCRLALALGKDLVQSAAELLSCLLLYVVCSLDPWGTYFLF